MKLSTLLTLLVSIILSSCGKEVEKFEDQIHEVELFGLSDDSAVLGITVPTLLSYERGEGVDFYVHYFKNGSGDIIMGIYVGHHPNLLIENPTIFKEGLVGGREVKWAEERLDNSYVSETTIEWFMMPDSSHKGFLDLNSSKVHLFIRTDIQEEFAKMKASCESLRLIRPKESMIDEAAGNESIRELNEYIKSSGESKSDTPKKPMKQIKMAIKMQHSITAPLLFRMIFSHSK